MKVIKAYPPMYPQIKSTFGLRDDAGVIFSWGDRIFVPNLTCPLSASLLEHESIHGARQLAFDGGVTRWWHKYLEDPQFRLDEEIPAHRAEYAWHVKNEGRGGRERALNKVALRLSGALYKNMVSYNEAVLLVTAS